MDQLKSPYFEVVAFELYHFGIDEVSLIHRNFA